VWDVGSRIGAALRAAKASHEVELTQDQHDRNEEGTIKERKRPRPHIRRAHWHTILSGPMTGARRRDVRWMPPTPVNIEHGEIIPTFHPVN
jgi:hypothetical protein